MGDVEIHTLKDFGVGMKGAQRRVIANRVPTRETSLSSQCLYSVQEQENDEGQDISTHGQLPDGHKDCVSGFVPFEQSEVKMLEDEDELVVNFSSVRCTKTAQMHAGTLGKLPVTSKRLLDTLAGNPFSLEYTALLLESKALTALNRDPGHPSIPVFHGMLQELAHAHRTWPWQHVYAHAAWPLTHEPTCCPEPRSRTPTTNPTPNRYTYNEPDPESLYL